MEEYICIVCDKEFKYKSLLDKHKARKIPCKKEINKELNIETIKRDYNNIVNKIYKHTVNTKGVICGFCNISYSTRSNVLKHVKNSCIEKKKMEAERDKIKYGYDLLKEQEKEKENKATNVVNNTNITNNMNNTNTSNTNNTTNTNNITNNITNNNVTLQLQINSFGKEDISYITLEDVKKCLDRRFPGLFHYIKLVHFNKNAPQNHNLLLTNERSKFIKVYKNGKFKREYKNEVIEDILNKNMGRLEDKATELEEEGQISDTTIQNHKEFKNVYYKNDKDVIKRNMETVENMLLDEKDIIEDTHTKMIK